MYERRVDRATTLARQALAAIGRELRSARIAGGLTQRQVGALVGLSHSQVSRIERGTVPDVSYTRIAAIASVVGLTVPLRAYPGDDPVRDAG